MGAGFSSPWPYFGESGPYPLVYYFAFAIDRYRHPIEPELVILAVFWLASDVGRRKNRKAEA